MELKTPNKVFHISKEKNCEYERLFDFSDYDFESKWFTSVLHIPDEEIYVLCNHVLFEYIKNKSKNRTDWEEIRAWECHKVIKMSKSIQRKRFPNKLNDILFLLGNISSCIMIRRRIPKIRKYKTIFGSFKDLIKLNRILFNKANYLIKINKK
jgi:hypothetical protein